MPLIPALTLGAPLNAPENFKAAIIKARATLEAARLNRPSNLDIPALTAWVHAKAEAEGALELLEAHARSVWIDLRKPSKKGTGTPRKAPEARLRNMLRKHGELVSSIATCPDRRACSARRQQIFVLRREIGDLCRAHDLPVLKFTPVPANPFTLAGRTDPGRTPSIFSRRGL